MIDKIQETAKSKSVTSPLYVNLQCIKYRINCKKAGKLGDSATYKDVEMYNIGNEMLLVKALFECVAVCQLTDSYQMSVEK